tara:strand:- start:102 stop:293 length:192 start_codon:yes stop_codon:yes gene_type:complete
MQIHSGLFVALVQKSNNDSNSTIPAYRANQEEGLYEKNDRKVLMQKVMIDGKELDLPVIDVKV